MTRRLYDCCSVNPIPNHKPSTASTVFFVHETTQDIFCSTVVRIAHTYSVCQMTVCTAQYETFFSCVVSYDFSIISFMFELVCSVFKQENTHLLCRTCLSMSAGPSMWEWGFYTNIDRQNLEAPLLQGSIVDWSTSLSHFLLFFAFITFITWIFGISLSLGIDHVHLRFLWWSVHGSLFYLFTKYELICQSGWIYVEHLAVNSSLLSIYCLIHTLTVLCCVLRPVVAWKVVICPLDVFDLLITRIG